MRWQRIKKSVAATRGRRWALRYLKGLALVALLANFLANDRPLVASFQGEIRFPVFREMLEPLTGKRPYGDLPGRSWRKATTDWAIWPPVSYTAGELDMRNDVVSPFEAQKPSLGGRHWLGTGDNGRDVLAGIIAGSRVAILVGLIAMSIALLIGLLLGGLAGYFGNDRMLLQRYQAWAIGCAALVIAPYLLKISIPFGADAGLLSKTVGYLLLPILIGGLIYIFFKLIGKLHQWWQKKIRVAVDRIIMRLIELFNALPTLVILIAFLPLIDSPTIFTVMLIIGLIRWTGIARFVRAELLRIRQLPYIDAARLSGFSQPYILLRHALPNALGPVIIALSFGMAGAILLEAYLSFLGVGLSPDQVSWGSLLRQSRDVPTAWWLAIFPGLSIFFTILSLNIIGEALRE